jgi:ankyrin repeat protein
MQVNVDVVKALLAAGADPTIQGMRMATPLYVALTKQQSSDLTKQQSSDLTKPQSPELKQIVDAFLEHKSVKDFINLQTINGNTCLHRAVLNGNEEVVKALLTAGADPSIKNKMGQTPLDLIKIEIEKKSKQLNEKDKLEKIKQLLEPAKERATDTSLDPDIERALGFAQKIETEKKQGQGHKSR